MKTSLHLKLEGYCKKLRTDKKCWLLTGSALVRIPELACSVTTKRALYAAFIGEIPNGYEVVENCGNKFCVRPDHQALNAKLNSAAKGFSLPDQIEALSREAAIYQAPDKPTILPKGLTVRHIHTVKHLAKFNSLKEIRNATGLGYHMIMQIKCGVYDAAVKNVQSSTIKRRSDKHRLKKAQGAFNEPHTRLPTPEPVVRVVETGAEVPFDMGEDEENWLAMLGKG